MTPVRHLLLLAAAAGAACSTACAAGSLAGRASVVDGDTLEIRGVRIRLHGVDAPESRQECREGGRTWRCGKEAAMALAGWLGQRTVRCERKAVDRYQRMVAVCRVGEEDLGAWLVREGWALAYRRYGGGRYAAEEETARKERRGIWAGECDPPWEWRKARR